jgi:hypothetical protein
VVQTECRYLLVARDMNKRGTCRIPTSRRSVCGGDGRHAIRMGEMGDDREKQGKCTNDSFSIIHRAAW